MYNLGISSICLMKGYHVSVYLACLPFYLHQSFSIDKISQDLASHLLSRMVLGDFYSEENSPLATWSNWSKRRQKGSRFKPFSQPRKVSPVVRLIRASEVLQQWIDTCIPMCLVKGHWSLVLGHSTSLEYRALCCVVWCPLWSLCCWSRLLFWVRLLQQPGCCCAPGLLSRWAQATLGLDLPQVRLQHILR